MRLIHVNSVGKEILGPIGSDAIIVGCGAAATVRIEGSGVAEAHVRLTTEVIEAIAPCMVGDVLLAPGQTRSVVAYVPIRLGEALLYVDSSPRESDEDAAASVPTRDLVFADLGDLAESSNLWPTVLVVEGPARGARLALREEHAYSIGRAVGAALQLDAPSVSRAHVDVRRVGSVVRVLDRGAARGTFLGSDRLAPGREAVWSPHRMLRVGDAVLALVIPGFREAPLGPALRANVQEPENPAAGESSSAPALELAEGAIRPGSQPPLDRRAAAIADVPPRALAARVRPRLASALFVGLVVMVGVLSLAFLVYVLIV